MEGNTALEESLIRSGLISAEDLKRLARIREEQDGSLLRLAIDLGFVSEENLLPFLSDYFSIPFRPLKEFREGTLPIESFPGAIDFYRHYRVVPLFVDGDQLFVATADPLNLVSFHALEMATGLRVQPILAREKEIVERIELLSDQPSPRGPSAAVRPDQPGPALGGPGEEEEDVEHLRDMASETPVIRFVNQMLGRALESRASDIHIEPFERDLKVRYRIDGVLHEIEPPPRQLRAAIVSRVKILAQLDIAERRLPQDGRIKTKIAGKDVDLRVATIPTLYGESVVIRLLERSQVFADLESLGLSPRVLDRFREMIAKPHGMVLVTGPTGSGKTTTLYAALQKINDPGKKIITIEDPVEYQLTGINQIQVKPQIGLTFANGLRSIVRQDPDVIMVGEIRDLETAEIAVQAALTGHLVFSTLHTNDAAGAVTRMLEMGVPDYLLGSCLLGVLAQRLVRRLCLGCRNQIPLVASEFEGIQEQLPQFLWEPAGCELCNDTGYLGRIGIFELLPATQEICRLISKRSDAARIRDLAVNQGMQLLREDGLRKVAEGITARAEVLRVTREEG